MLLQSLAGWTSKRCRTNRQAEHPRFHRLLPDRLRREADDEVGLGTCTHCHRNAADDIAYNHR